MKNLGNFHQQNWLVLSQMTWRIWEIFNRAHSKVQKLGLFLGAFIQSRKCVSLKFTEQLCVMRMKNDTKFEEELTCQFKIDMSNFMNFESSTWKSQSLISCFWLKYITFELKKVQRSYFWFHCRLMQNLKENWLVRSKMTWRIWEIFTTAPLKV